MYMQCVDRQLACMHIECVYLWCAHSEMGVFVMCTQRNGCICGMYTDKCVYLWYVHRQMCIFVVCTQMCIFVVCTQTNVYICGMYTDKCVYLCCLQVACMHVELCLTAVYTRSNVFVVCLQRTGFVSCQPGVQRWGSSCTTGRRRSDGSLDIPSCTVAETTSTSFSPRESCCEATAVSYFTVLGGDGPGVGS